MAGGSQEIEPEAATTASVGAKDDAARTRRGDGAAAGEPGGEAAQINRCLSCEAEVVGPYCWNCGQKNDDCRRSVLRLAGEAVSETLAYDGRMWRTIGQLAAAPGTVPKGYSEGRRSRYTPPVRLFLIVSFLFFLALAFTSTNFLQVEVAKIKIGEVTDSDETIRENLLREVPELAELEELQETLADLPDLPENMPEEVREQLESIPENFEGRELTDYGLILRNDDGVYLLRPSLRVFARPSDEEMIDREDLDLLLSEMEIEIEDDSTAREWTAGFARGAIRAIEDPSSFNAVFNAWLPRVMFFMMPMLALIMALFFRGRDALIYDHLILSLYVHSVAFLIVTAALMISYIQGGASVAGATGLFIFLYFLIALKRAYRRGWIKTLLSGAVIALIYVIFLSIAIGIIVVEAFLGLI